MYVYIQPFLLESLVEVYYYNIVTLINAYGIDFCIIKRICDKYLFIIFLDWSIHRPILIGGIVLLILPHLEWFANDFKNLCIEKTHILIFVMGDISIIKFLV